MACFPFQLDGHGSVAESEVLPRTVPVRRPTTETTELQGRQSTQHVGSFRLQAKPGEECLEVRHLCVGKRALRRAQVARGNSEVFQGGTPERMGPFLEKGHVVLEDNLTGFLQIASLDSAPEIHGYFRSEGRKRAVVGLHPIGNIGEKLRLLSTLKNVPAAFEKLIERSSEIDGEF